MKPIVNPEDVKDLTESHELFNRILKAHGLPPNWQRPEGFVSLARIILEQQVSLTSANAHYTKLVDYIGELTPVNLLRLSDEDMRNNQISRQKASYLRHLSTSVKNGSLNLETLPDKAEEDIRLELTKVKGIGHWTTDVYLMFCLQAKDVFPIGDVAIVNTVREFTGLTDREDIEHLAESWRPLRSLATYFLWHYYLEKRNRKGF